MPVSTSHGQRQREREARHGIDIVRNQQAHRHQRSQETGDANWKGVLIEIPIVEQWRLPNGSMYGRILIFHALQIVCRECLEVSRMEQRVGIARRDHDVLDFVHVVLVLHDETHGLSKAPIGVGCLGRDLVIETERVNGKENGQKLVAVPFANQCRALLAVGRARFPGHDENEAFRFGLLSE